MKLDDLKFEAEEECLCCMMEFDDENIVHYTDKPDGDWRMSPYCYNCLKYIQDTYWNTYVDTIKKADCKASLRRAIAEGPPVNIRDKALPCDNDTSEVYQLQFQKEVISAKLKGSYEGNKRLEWWDELKEVLQGMDDKPLEESKK